MGTTVRQKVAKAIRRRLRTDRPQWKMGWLTLLGLWLFPRWMRRRQDHKRLEVRAQKRAFYRRVKQTYNRTPHREI